MLPDDNQPDAHPTTARSRDDAASSSRPRGAVWGPWTATNEPDDLARHESHRKSGSTHMSQHAAHEPSRDPQSTARDTTRAARAVDDATPRRAEKRARDEPRDEDGMGRPPSTAELAETSNLPERASRGKRKATYDETKRRTKPRRPLSGPRPVYLEKGNGRGAKRTAIVLGPAAIERIVGGRYEWRDAGFKRPRNAGR